MKYVAELAMLNKPARSVLVALASSAPLTTAAVSPAGSGLPTVTFDCSWSYMTQGSIRLLVESLSIRSQGI